MQWLGAVQMRGSKITLAMMLGFMAAAATASNKTPESSIIGRLVKLEPTTSTAQPIIPPAGEYRVEGYGSIALQNYQQIVRYKNGCGQLITDAEGSYNYISQSTWIGGCRFGLIHGKGFALYEGQYATGEYQSLTASYGRIIIPPDMAMAYVRRTNSQPVHITMQPIMPPKPEVLRASGPIAFAILAIESFADDQAQVTKTLNMGKYTCPVLYGGNMAETLGYETGAKQLPKQSFSALVKFCKAADSRLRSENPSGYLSIGSFTAYDKLDYGHYFTLGWSESRAVRRGHSYSYDAKDGYTSRNFDVKLCPQISSSVGCEAVWRAMATDYEQRLAKLREESPAIEAAGREEWNAHFEPLEQQRRQRWRDLASGYAAEQTRPTTAKSDLAPAAQTGKPVGALHREGQR